MFKRESKKGHAALAIALVLIGVFAMTAAGASVLEPEAPLSDVKGELVATLSPGDFVFWEGPDIDEHRGVDGHPLDPVLCGEVWNRHSCVEFSSPTMWVYWSGGQYTAGEVACQAEPKESEEPVCIDYLIEVEGDGSELAVSLDHPSAYNQFEVNLISPAKEVVEGSGCAHVCNTFETNAPNPIPGLWTFRVFVHNAADTGFRMRAILHPEETEADITAIDSRQQRGGPGRVQEDEGLLLPNLQMMAPFELVLSDCQLAEELNVEERTYEAQRCLRFSTGPTNAGAGPLELRPATLDGADAIDPTILTEGDNIQRIYNSDGKYDDHRAGSYEWHATHGHYHHTAMGDFELDKVTNSHSGKLVPVSRRHKEGFCIGDATINNWESFDNARQGEVSGRCTAMVDPPIGPVNPEVPATPETPAQDLGPMFYMGNGWGDPYPWWVGGNFMEADGLTDGLYVLRVSTDPENTIIESNDLDNISYSYFRLKGNKIEVLERGRGLNPWDKKKEIANDTRWPTLQPR